MAVAVSVGFSVDLSVDVRGHVRGQVRWGFCGRFRAGTSVDVAVFASADVSVGDRGFAVDVERVSVVIRGSPWKWPWHALEVR